LYAAALRLPFLPTRAGLGSDALSLNPWLRTVRSPYDDGEEFVAMQALELDAALVHVNRADPSGNAQILGPDPYFDDLFCMAARRRFVSSERIVPTEELLRGGPIQTMRIHRGLVDGVVDAPHGAAFTSCEPDYGPRRGSPARVRGQRLAARRLARVLQPIRRKRGAVTLDFALHELCVVACAEAWRGDGEILASPIGTLPAVAARLAKTTFAPDLLLTDGEAALMNGPFALRTTERERIIEGWMPYRAIFDLVWSGRRHVMMGASQIDRFGNQNISCIGNHAHPKVQLIGMRGAPGNTINHPTSYWIASHSPRVFVPRVDVVCGVGYDRAAALGRSGRFHEIRRVVTNLCVLDFETPDRTMRSRHAIRACARKIMFRAAGFRNKSH